MGHSSRPVLAPSPCAHAWRALLPHPACRYTDDCLVTHEIAPKMASWGVFALTLHGRTRQQRYARTADWGYIERVAAAAPDLQLVGNGDVFSFTDFHSHLESGAWRSRRHALTASAHCAQPK